ncbi:MAG: LemA family protein [Candidatus Pacebacteria bacterium]|nr:LemA family protein [Candidatus Paceibacterota bacterium]
MSKTIKIIIIAVVIIGAIILYATSVYNKLVTMSTSVDAQWAQVETQYQRRVDLIPNLVESVKGVMKQETTVFLGIAEARKSYAGATSVEEKVKAGNQVESALGKLLVIMENYPQLNSSQSVQTLMAQLEGAENRISVERTRYNDAVKTFNLTIKKLPVNIFAGMFGFIQRDYFEAAPGAENAPSVSF